MTLNVFTDLESLPSAYVSLFDAASRGHLFRGLDWFRLLAKTALDDGRSLRVYGLEKPGGIPRAVLVAVTGKGVIAGELFAGRALSSFSNFYTMTFEPIVAPGETQQAAIAELMAEIMAEHPRWDTVRIAPMDRDTSAFSHVVGGLERAGAIVRPYFVCGNWYEPTADGSFDAFLSRRPSQLRNTFRRRRKKLEEDATARFVLTTGREGLDEALAAYQAIYARSWKEPERYPGFMTGFAELAADRGWLRLGVISVDGTPAAAQFWLVDDDQAVIYKLAYDERFRQQSVGTILTMYMMQHVIEVDRVREVDYGSGDDPYKKDWMSRRRERWGIVAYNPATVRGLAGSMTTWFGGWIRGFRTAETAPSA